MKIIRKNLYNRAREFLLMREAAETASYRKAKLQKSRHDSVDDTAWRLFCDLAQREQAEIYLKTLGCPLRKPPLRLKLVPQR